MEQPCEAPKGQPKIGYRTSGDDMVDFLSGNAMRAHRLDRHTAPGWYGALEELSAKAGVSPPALYHVPTHRINGGMAFDALVLTDGLLATCGSHVRDPRPSREVMMIMAHEIGHHRQGFGLNLARVHLPKLMPLAAMTGLYLYDQAVLDKKTQSRKELRQSIDSATDKTIADMKQAHLAADFEDEQARYVTMQSKENTLQAGRYVLIGALGLSAGLMGTRAISRHMEFDADRMAVKLMGGDVDGYVQMLKKIGQKGRALFREEEKLKPRPDNVAEKIQDFLATLRKDIESSTLHAHPSDKEREAFLRRSFRDSALASRQGISPSLGG